MLPACAALVASLTLQAGVTQYTANLQTQARYLTDLEALAPISTTALEVVPTLGLTSEDRASRFGIAYFPRLLLAIDAPPPQIFNQASLNFALQTDPALRLSGAANACYGTNDFRTPHALTCGAVALAPAPGAGPQPVPRTTTVKYMSASAALGLEWHPSARLGLSGTLSYLVQGGADAPSRALLPLQRGPSFLVAVGWTAGRSDSLTTSLSGSYYTFLREGAESGTGGLATNTWISELIEMWRHSVGRGGRLRLGLGIGVIDNAVVFPRSVPRRTSVVGEVGFQQAFGGLEDARRPDGGEPPTGRGPPGWSPAILLDVSARVAPFVDFTNGLAYDRAETFAGLGWPLDLDWRLDASLSASIVLDGIQHEQATGEGRLSATFAAARWCRLSTELSGLWQRAGPDYPASTIRQVGFSFSVTFLGGGKL